MNTKKMGITLKYNYGFAKKLLQFQGMSNRLEKHLNDITKWFWGVLKRIWWHPEANF